MTGETINTQDLEEMTKIVGTILETNTEPDVELDDSVLTGAEEYAAEYVNAEKVDDQNITLLAKLPQRAEEVIASS